VGTGSEERRTPGVSKFNNKTRESAFKNIALATDLSTPGKCLRTFPADQCNPRSIIQVM